MMKWLWYTLQSIFVGMGAVLVVLLAIGVAVVGLRKASSMTGMPLEDCVVCAFLGVLILVMCFFVGDVLRNPDRGDGFYYW